MQFFNFEKSGCNKDLAKVFTKTKNHMCNSLYIFLKGAQTVAIWQFKLKQKKIH